LYDGSRIERWRWKGDVAVTDINAAAARRLRRPSAHLSVCAIIGAGLALSGCGSSSGPLGGLLAQEPEPAVAAPAAPPAATASKRVAIAPVIGAPDTISKQLGEQMTQSLTQQRVATFVSPADRSDYTLRGYVVAAREKSAIKVSYIWDVTDPTGKRVNRVTGEEVVPAAASVKDPWSVVTPQIVQAIASKSSTSLGTWISSQGQPTSPPMASGPGPAPSPIASAPTGPVAEPAVASAAQIEATPASVGVNTASINTVSASVPSVSGAPGDGGVSLTGAIQRELAKSGVNVADRGSPTTYVVEGKVKMSPPKDGKQTIEIDWRVKDPKGKALGTVTQKNEVPQGSLDGSWGKTADAAAAAAAQGIVKLLPSQQTRTN